MGGEPASTSAEEAASSQAAEGEALGELALPEVSLGEPFEYIGEQNRHPTAETMTVRGVECGIKEVPEGLSNPDWDGSEEVPEDITLTADAGMEFCRIDATHQNTSQYPLIGWSDFENLVTEDGVNYAEDEKASEATMNRNECAPSLCSERNPGMPPMEVVKFYHVPERTVPAFVNYPTATIVSGPHVRFRLT